MASPSSSRCPALALLFLFALVPAFSQAASGITYNEFISPTAATTHAARIMEKTCFGDGCASTNNTIEFYSATSFPKLQRYFGYIYANATYAYRAQPGYVFSSLKLQTNVLGGYWGWANISYSEDNGTTWKRLYTSNKNMDSWEDVNNNTAINATDLLLRVSLQTNRTEIVAYAANTGAYPGWNVTLALTSVSQTPQNSLLFSNNNALYSTNAYQTSAGAYDAWRYCAVVSHVGTQIDRVGMGFSPYNYSVWVFNNDGTLLIDANNGTARTYLLSVAPYSQNANYSLCVEKTSSSDLRFYLNGVLSGQIANVTLPWALPTFMTSTANFDSLVRYSETVENISASSPQASTGWLEPKYVFVSTVSGKPWIGYWQQAAVYDPNAASCVQDSFFACTGGNISWYDSCGNKGAIKEGCGGNGCGWAYYLGGDGSGHYECSPTPPACTPNVASACLNGDLHWYDSCGNVGALKQSCGGYGCANNQCNGAPTPTPAPTPAPTPTPVVLAPSPTPAACAQNSYSACFDDDVYWFDSCGNQGAVKELCPSYDCQNNQCQPYQIVFSPESLAYDTASTSTDAGLGSTIAEFLVGNCIRSYETYTANGGQIDAGSGLWCAFDIATLPVAEAKGVVVAVGIVKIGVNGERLVKVIPVAEKALDGVTAEKIIVKDAVPLTGDALKAVKGAEAFGILESRYPGLYRLFTAGGKQAEDIARLIGDGTVSEATRMARRDALEQLIAKGGGWRISENLLRVGMSGAVDNFGNKVAAWLHVGDNSYGWTHIRLRHILNVQKGTKFSEIGLTDEAKIQDKIFDVLSNPATMVKQSPDRAIRCLLLDSGTPRYLMVAILGVDGKLITSQPRKISAVVTMDQAIGAFDCHNPR